MCKKHDNYKKTERYLREEESANKYVGQNETAKKVGQTDVQRQQDSQKKEHGKEHEKGSKKSNFHKN